MKININGPGRDERARLRRERKLKWHKKFAWLPTIIDETETSYSIVWGETYMRRMVDRERSIRPYWMKKLRKWECKSKTEYMKQKLANKIKEARRYDDAACETSALSAPAQMGQSSQILKYNGTKYTWFWVD